MSYDLKIKPPMVPLEEARPTNLKSGMKHSGTVLSDLERQKLKLKKATHEFESFFTSAMLKSMRATIPKEETSGMNLGGGLGKDIFEEIFDSELAKQIARGSENGLGDLLYKTLLPRIESQIETKVDSVKSGHETDVSIRKKE